MKEYHLFTHSRSDSIELAYHLAHATKSRNFRDKSGIELTRFGPMWRAMSNAPRYNGEEEVFVWRLRATRRQLKRGFLGLKFRPDRDGGFTVTDASWRFIAQLTRRPD